MTQTIQDFIEGEEKKFSEDFKLNVYNISDGSYVMYIKKRNQIKSFQRSSMYRLLERVKGDVLGLDQTQSSRNDWSISTDQVTNLLTSYITQMK